MKIELIIIVSILLIITVIVIAIYNNLITKKKKVERNKALVDVYLKKRYDLIPNLVEVCKGYSKFEQKTLEDITKLRSTFNANPNEENTKELSMEYQKLIALVENYPELKASESFLKLQKEMVNVENELQASRRIYINSITDYNNLVMVFPVSLIANITSHKQMELPKYDYDEVKIKF